MQMMRFADDACPVATQKKVPKAAPQSLRLMPTAAPQSLKLMTPIQTGRRLLPDETDEPDSAYVLMRQGRVDEMARMRDGSEPRPLPPVAIHPEPASTTGSPADLIHGCRG